MMEMAEVLKLVVLLVMVIWCFFSVEYVKEYNTRGYR